MAGVSVRTSGTVANILAPVEMLADNRGKQAMARALNHTLAKTETAVNRATAKQAGLKYGDVKKEIRRFSANAEKLEGEIKGEGGYHKLSAFKPNKTKRGVSAAPWGERKVFKSTFFIGKGVFKRVGDKRFPVKTLYGPAVPKEMVRRKAKEAFENTVGSALPGRVLHEMARLIGR